VSRYEIVVATPATLDRMRIFTKRAVENLAAIFNVINIIHTTSFYEDFCWLLYFNVSRSRLVAVYFKMPFGLSNRCPF